LTVASVELGLRSGLVPRAVRRLRARSPGLEVAVREMTSLPQWEAVRDGAAAAGVCYTPPPADDPDLAADWLLNDPLAVALVAADHPLGGGAADGRSGDPPAAPLAVLADEPLLLFPRAVNPIFHDRLFAAFRAAGFRPRVLEQASDGQGAYALAAEGLGWTLQPASYAAAPPPGTAAVRLVDFALPLSLHLLRRRDGRPPAARVFGAALRAVLRAGGRGAPEAT
jgi:DNA-binding transcriptional LysR family regulator